MEARPRASSPVLLPFLNSFCGPLPSAVASSLFLFVSFGFAHDDGRICVRVRATEGSADEADPQRETVRSQTKKTLRPDLRVAVRCNSVGLRGGGGRCARVRIRARVRVTAHQFSPCIHIRRYCVRCMQAHILYCTFPHFLYTLCPWWSFLPLLCFFPSISRLRM